MRNKIIELKKIDLTYNRDKSNSYRALSDIDLVIEKNDFAIIFGPSGCGKSTLLNVISGLESPDRGAVLINDDNIYQISRRERVNFHRKTVGMIFQSYNLISSLKILDNVAIGHIFLNRSRKQREEKALEILNRFGVKEQAYKMPTELSGGQQQRIGIARAIMNDQPIILADEPVGNLDSKSATNVMQILSDLNKKEKKTIVMVSHNEENIMWGNHIIYMKDGKIIKEEFRDERDGVVETRNSQKVEDEATKLEGLLRSFQGLSSNQIRMLIAPMKAKIITRSLLIDMSEGQLNTLEDSIRQRILGSITADDFFKKLDRAGELGGVDMDARTARKITKKVENLITVAKLISNKEKNIEEKQEGLLDYLMIWEGFRMTEKQLEIFKEILRGRLLSQIDREEFGGFLDRSIKFGGVGFNKATAKKIRRRVELIFMIGYGML